MLDLVYTEKNQVLVIHLLHSHKTCLAPSFRPYKAYLSFQIISFDVLLSLGGLINTSLSSVLPCRKADLMSVLLLSNAQGPQFIGTVSLPPFQRWGYPQNIQDVVPLNP